MILKFSIQTEIVYYSYQNRIHSKNIYKGIFVNQFIIKFLES